MKLLLITGILFLLAACGVPEVSTPAPTQSAIIITYPPSLESWMNKFSECASADPFIAIYLDETPFADNNLDPNHLILELGAPSSEVSDNFIAQLGMEQIAVIVNQKNKLSQLSTNQLQSIFSGQTSTWDKNSEGQIRVWVLPDGDIVSKYFDQAILQNNLLTSKAMLAPDPKAMLDAISKDSDGIGYLPESVLSTVDPKLVGDVKIINLEPSLQEQLHQPVLVITKSGPDILFRKLLVCVQTAVP
jgi:PBP superfamily domain